MPTCPDDTLDTEAVVRLWPLLHAGDGEPLPCEPGVMRAWMLCHQGDFDRAAEAGLAAGGSGIVAACKALVTRATCIEGHEKARLEMLQQAARHAQALCEQQPGLAGGWYWQAAALGRYSQGISVARALSQGLGGRIRAALERAIALRPAHADAHIALGMFHAEAIDKVGELVARMTCGADRDDGLRALREGLRLHPHSVMGLLEAANGLLMLGGDALREEAAALYERAAGCEPLDAIDRLHLERLRMELQD